MRIRSRKLRLLLITLACGLSVFLCFTVWKQWLSPWLFPANPLVITPSVALAELKAHNLFFSNEARLWLNSLRPDLLHADDRDSDSPRSRAMRQANINPKLFRQLDRQVRFDTVLLLGDPSGFKRLLDHLIEPEPSKRDFRLVYLDHWTYVFKRGNVKQWDTSDAAALRTKMASVASADRAIFLSKSAAKMLAISEMGLAHTWLEEALALDGRSLDALAGMANYQATIGKWKEAESFADRALAEDANFVPALAAQIVTQRATAHFLDAFRTSKRLNMLIPEDPMRLWQHAETAREARLRAEQIEALERLIKLAEEEDRPTGLYHFYKGDAHIYMSSEDATHVPKAFESFRRALADPTLSPEHRKFAEERMATIRERTGLK